MGYRTSFYARSFVGKMEILHPQAALNKKFSSTFFKRWWCPEGKALGARRSGRNLIVSAHFGKLENFLQVKKFSKTDCELAFAPNTR